MPGPATCCVKEHLDPRPSTASIERMNGIVRNLAGKRLTYRQQLAAGNALCGRL